MGKTILHVGETGSAKLVKNAMAMFAAVQHMALTEIFFWLKKGGLAEEAFQQILANSQQRSEALERILQVLISRRFKPRKSWMPKDVGFGLDMARQMETPVPLAALSYQLFAVAQAAGLDGYEATGIAYHVYELINGGKAKGA
ncbi:MAG TPA: NAD-binding protein [Candidatus Acidoferrales bacterium]|nr:NAD-binding protein [Candidatus Acidoferrales bacterium]